jgi:hypothetical protein
VRCERVPNCRSGSTVPAELRPSPSVRVTPLKPTSRAFCGLPSSVRPRSPDARHPLQRRRHLRPRAPHCRKFDIQTSAAFRRAPPYSAWATGITNPRAPGPPTIDETPRTTQSSPSSSFTRTWSSASAAGLNASVLQIADPGALAPAELGWPQCGGAGCQHCADSGTVRRRRLWSATCLMCSPSFDGQNRQREPSSRLLTLRGPVAVPKPRGRGQSTRR